jgi:hypothetical protein
MSLPILSKYLVSATRVNEKGDTLVYSTRTTRKNMLSENLWNKLTEQGATDLPQEVVRELLSRKYSFLPKKMN